MLTNIVDSRKNTLDWSNVWGVVEPTWADNPIEGSSKSEDRCDFFIQNRGPASLSELIEWASGISEHETTLYLYGEDPLCAEGGCSLTAKAMCDC